MRGGRLPDPGLAALCATCREPREAHGGPKHYGACPGRSGLHADRFRIAEEDRPEPEITVRKLVGWRPITQEVLDAALPPEEQARITAERKAKYEAERCTVCGCHPDEHGG